MYRLYELFNMSWEAARSSSGPPYQMIYAACVNTLPCVSICLPSPLCYFSLPCSTSHHTTRMRSIYKMAFVPQYHAYSPCSPSPRYTSFPAMRVIPNKVSISRLHYSSAPDRCVTHYSVVLLDTTSCWSSLPFTSVPYLLFPTFHSFSFSRCIAAEVGSMGNKVVQGMSGDPTSSIIVKFKVFKFLRSYKLAFRNNVKMCKEDGNCAESVSIQWDATWE